MKKKITKEEAGDGAMQTHDANRLTDRDFLLVGIGASAGGIHALKEFFENVPKKSGVAFVVILHLSPDHDSRLAEVLQGSTGMPVSQVTERVLVEPDHVYVVPPNKHLTMLDGSLDVSPNMTSEDRRAPVDIFFRTLAESHGSRAVAVILSGTGANGSMGLKRVKERGGAAFVQNPREAEFNEMPRNAIATDLIDDVLPVASIPARVIAYRDSLGTVEIEVDADKSPGDQQQALRDIFVQLRLQTGHDFTNYKRPTLLRRIERRINIHNLPDLSSYAALVRANPEEVRALLKDLLISVTNFFRDKDPFLLLGSEIIPRIFAEKSEGDSVRIWCVGCATGEEAYSLAMLCSEHVAGMIDAPKVQIFATDIDESALAIAREGLYSINDAADVSSERLARFFTKEGDDYRVRRELREMILFANHNVIKDPPFSHLDLVSCRNLLIYLNQRAKERLMETFHFALSAGSYLLLGSSESVDGASDLFSTADREQHLYRTRPTGGPRLFPVPESVPSFRFEGAGLTTRSDEKPMLDRTTYGDLHGQLLEKYSPPSVVINEEYEIVHVSEHAGRYLQVPGGESSTNLLKLILPELRLELRTALYQATQHRTNVEAKNLKVGAGDDAELVSLHVRPVLAEDDGRRGFILIVFESNVMTVPPEGPLTKSDEPLSIRLEGDVARLKAQLRSSGEQYEVQAEELKASNEELQAINEELRSAAEELETSKEELQSINEELRTVNQELKVKVEETMIASNNLRNLINSTDVGTIFLDLELRVQLFTPSVRDIFNLIPADYGRPLSDITHKLAYGDLTKDAKSVLENLHTIESEISTTEGRSFLMRIVPYRTSEDRVNGVVITFLEITARKLTEAALRQTEERMRLVVDSANDYAIFTTDLDGQIKSWNVGAELMFGYAESEIIGRSAKILFTEEDQAAGALELEASTAFEDGRAANERYHARKDGSRFYGSGVIVPLCDDSGNAIGLVKIMRDLTFQKEVQDELERFNRAAVGRETRMIDLKKEINDLTDRLGEKSRYRVEFDGDD